jgi:hypothetical protein
MIFPVISIATVFTPEVPTSIPIKTPFDILISFEDY